jgi:hypothetical protein
MRPNWRFTERLVGSYHSGMPTIAHKSQAPAKANQPVDASQAAAAAFQYFHTLFPNYFTGQVHPGQVHPVYPVRPGPDSDPSLEEIELSKDGRYWLVTLGFSISRSGYEHLPKFLRVPLRKLKVFKVQAATGRVVSMKIPQDE